MSNIKFAYNLSAGVNHGKWQFKSKATNENTYTEPSTTAVRLLNCHLTLTLSQSKKIAQGANKTRCAWIHAEAVNHLSASEIGNISKHSFVKLSYNPRRSVHWQLGGKDVADVKALRGRLKEVWVIGRNLLVKL